MQAQVARDYVSSQEGAEGKDVSVFVVDWLSTSGLKEQFDVGYDYTCAPLPCMGSARISLYRPRFIA